MTAFTKITEQDSLYDNLENKSVRELLDDINREDRKVAVAVGEAIPQVEKLVEQIVPRMQRGGRIFYLGAGTSGRLGVLDASEIPDSSPVATRRCVTRWKTPRTTPSAVGRSYRSVTSRPTTPW